MLRILVVGLMLLSLCGRSVAQHRHEWSKVEKLKPGAKVLVTLWTGEEIQGRVESVGKASLGIRTSSSWKPLQRFARADIQTIVHLRGPKLPDPERWMRNGALIGGAAGVTSGAIQDATQGNNGRVLTQGLAGAGLGFFASCATLAGVGAVALVRHDQLVYDDKARSRRPQAQKWIQDQSH